jgi:hypothetical protein
LDERPVDCVVAEYDLPGGTALTPFDSVRTSKPDAGCILFRTRGHEDLDTAPFGDTITEYLRTLARVAMDLIETHYRYEQLAIAENDAEEDTGGAERSQNEVYTRTRTSYRNYSLIALEKSC